jgi:hypothetical protein
MTAKYINVLVDSRTVAIGTPGGNLSLKIKSRAQQITLKPNISGIFLSVKLMPINFST